MPLNPIDIHIGANLRNARLRCGLSIDATAQALGVDSNQFRKIEEGERRLSAHHMMRLTGVFKVSVAQLFGHIPVDRSQSTEKLPSIDELLDIRERAGSSLSDTDLRELFGRALATSRVEGV